MLLFDLDLDSHRCDGLVQNKFLNGQFLKASLRRFFNFAENIKQELISFTTLIELGIYLPTRVGRRT